MNPDRNDSDPGPTPSTGESYGAQLWRLMPALFRHLIGGGGGGAGRSADALRRLWWDLRHGHDRARRRARFIVAASSAIALAPAVAVGLTMWLLVC
ncbi:hypothetical protein [Amycolatopsis sp. NPDC004079]|uniref:hypothetical protein n=1 Tax=Amycolatopsis sp. NPDC004079 TaxID=3154549 RepID=UPI0033B50382